MSPSCVYTLKEFILYSKKLDLSLETGWYIRLVESIYIAAALFISFFDLKVDDQQTRERELSARHTRDVKKPARSNGFFLSSPKSTPLFLCNI